LKPLLYSVELFEALPPQVSCTDAERIVAERYYRLQLLAAR